MIGGNGRRIDNGGHIMENIIVEHFASYNQRRYSTPWVCPMGPRGEYNFSVRCGTYTGNAQAGEEGDLVIFEPEVGQVYAWGQKDYRGSNTLVRFCVFDGERLVPCDKLGKKKEGSA
jgi:hypothetical protein